MSLPELVDADAIAQRAHVDHYTVHVWRRRHADFPQPVYRFKMGPVWQWEDVREWLQSTGRLTEIRPGDPQGS